MTNKTEKELLKQKENIIKKFELETKENDLNLVSLESIYWSLLEAHAMPEFVRVKKQIHNVLNVIKYVLSTDLIDENSFIKVQYTKNYINRGALVNELLEPFRVYYNSIGKNLKIHLLDSNNPASCKQFTTNENALIVCDSGIYLNNIKNCYYDYDLTSDKNKKLVKKLKDLKDLNGAVVEW